MADNYNIYKKCRFCGGDGIEEDSSMGGDDGIEQRQCDNCMGSGEVYWGQMREEESEE